MLGMRRTPCLRNSSIPHTTALGKTGSAWTKCYDNHNELVEKYDSKVEGWKEDFSGESLGQSES